VHRGILDLLHIGRRNRRRYAAYVRWVVLAAVLGCSAEPVEPPSRGGPFAIVTKLGGYERQMMIDPSGFAAFAAGELPGTFVVTMHTFTRDRLAAIFRREYRAGVWYSSSPSPDVIVDEVPRIAPQCDGCHADHAEAIGMFTLPAIRESALVDRTAEIACPVEGTTPCETGVYRDLRF
jgi:hypothetical protein